MLLRRAALISCVIVLLFATSCKRKGCTDPTATNYDAKAKKEDGSCIYSPMPLVDQRDALVGTYHCVDSLFASDTGPFKKDTTFDVVFEKHPDAEKLIIRQMPHSATHRDVFLSATNTFSFTFLPTYAKYDASVAGKFIGTDKLFMQFHSSNGSHKISGSK